MYALYSALLGLFLLLTLPYWLLQMMRHGKYRAGLRQRFGAVPATLAGNKQRSIWVHAVSVGEVMTSRPKSNWWWRLMSLNSMAKQSVEVATSCSVRSSGEGLPCSRHQRKTSSPAPSWREVISLSTHRTL